MSDIFNPFDSPDVKDPLDEEWAAKRRVAEELRHLTENLVTCTSDADSLNRLADDLAEQSKELLKTPQIKGRHAFEAFENGRYGTLTTLGYELNPLDGRSNPIAPPFRIWIEDNIAYGKTTLGWQYEGPPNSVHGGFVCALFDQFLGIAQRMTGQPGVTGTLTTRFIKPTPLCRELTLTGRVQEVQGRKNILVGEMWADDVLTASCEGLFIHISAERFRTLQEMTVDNGK